MLGLLVFLIDDTEEDTSSVEVDLLEFNEDDFGVDNILSSVNDLLDTVDGREAGLEGVVLGEGGVFKELFLLLLGVLLDDFEELIFLGSLYLDRCFIIKSMKLIKN